jgi:plasmid stabilization system protein ParE
MTTKALVALPEVAGDLRAAMTHYLSWRLDGSQHLLRKYEETIDLIARNPGVFPPKQGELRRAILRQSYYLVYFLLEPDRILVLAVLDGRRNPQQIQAIVAQRKQSWPKR